MLKRRMNEIALMNLDRIPHGTAGFGSTVTLLEGDQELVYQLVMPEDAEAEKGLISTSSPIGRAIRSISLSSREWKTTGWRRLPRPTAPPGCGACRWI